MTIALPNIAFQKATGGLGRPLPNEDHYTGIIFLQADTPVGFTSAIMQVLDVPHAESLGIAEGSATTGNMWYHINEFFKINDGARLYVGVYAALDAEVQLPAMQAAADGKIRQLGIWTPATLDDDDLEDIQTACDALFANHMPLIVVYSPNIAAVADLTTLIDLRAELRTNVSVVIGQDGGNAGLAIFEEVAGFNKTKTVGVIGAVMGAISKAAVHESIAWVGKFDITVGGSEYDVPALGNGDLIKSLTPAQLTSLNEKGYIFLLKHVGISGSYFNDSNNCAAINSDYNHIELVRTIDKAIRNIRTYMLPELNRPIYVDPSSGKLTADMVTYLEDKAGQALLEMERAGELSGYRVSINPEQNIIVSSELEIVVAKVPVGVARAIKIKIGYVTQLS